MSYSNGVNIHKYVGNESVDNYIFQRFDFWDNIDPTQIISPRQMPSIKQESDDISSDESLSFTHEFPNTEVTNVHRNQDLSITGKRRSVDSDDSFYQDHQDLHQQHRHQQQGSVSKRSNFILPVYQTIFDPRDILSNFPKEIFGAVNSGDIPSIDHLISMLCHSNCVCRWREPGYSIEKVGNFNLTRAFEVMLQSIPDSILNLESVKLSESKKHGLILVKCSFLYSGTVLDGTLQNYSEFYGFPIEPKNAVDYMDVSNLSEEEIKSTREQSDSIIRQGHATHLFGRTKAYFYFDPALRKIVGYNEKFKLLNFTAVNVNKLNSSKFS